MSICFTSQAIWRNLRSQQNKLRNSTRFEIVYLSKYLKMPQKNRLRLVNLRVCVFFFFFNSWFLICVQHESFYGRYRKTKRACVLFDKNTKSKNVRNLELEYRKLNQNLYAYMVRSDGYRRFAKHHYIIQRMQTVNSVIVKRII